MSKDGPLSPSPIPRPEGNAPDAAPVPTYRSNRPSRACTLRAAARMAQQQQQQQVVIERKKQRKEHHHHQHKKKPEGAGFQEEVDDDEEELPGSKEQCGNGSSSSRVVTQLVSPPEPSQLPRWTLRSMWEMASVLNFLNVFRDQLNVQAEFSVEELETALIMPNDTLGEIHIPLLKEVAHELKWAVSMDLDCFQGLSFTEVDGAEVQEKWKAIPPVTRMALTRDTWITVLCRKLRDWWHWVADGELPLVASQGLEIEMYKRLDPGVRLVILRALCDIRVEQEDIRSYIDNSIKRGTHLSVFRKDRIGGDSQGINYWYEDDEIIGHRLYREIRKVEMKKTKIKGSHVLPCTTYQWETVAANFDEFQEVSEKLFTSKNRTEASLGKKLKNNMLPEIEKVHKRKEKLLKKQHRQALLLDNYLNMDGLGPGRALRDRKPVTYTFDEYDRSINEAIKVTKKKPPSPEANYGQDGSVKPEETANGLCSGPSHGAFSSSSPDYDDFDEDHKPESVDRSNRRRQRPQRYSGNDFVEEVSDNDAESDSDDEIVGEAVYDEEYLKKRKKRKLSSSSEGDEEYQWDDENGEEEEEEEDEEDALSISEESDEPRKSRKLPSRTRRGTKLRPVGALQSGLRRSKRASRNRINYQQYDLSDSEAEAMNPEKPNESDEHSDTSENAEYSSENEDFNVNDSEPEVKVEQPVASYTETTEKEENQPPEKSDGPVQDADGATKRRFLDLNELAPGSGFDDGPNTVKDDDRDEF